MAAAQARRDDELDTWRRLVVLTNQISNTLDRRLQRVHGVSVAEYTALVVMQENKRSGGIRMQDLADAIGLSQSTVSRLVARLEKDGLTERTIGAEDRRVTYAHVTEAGETVVAEAAGTFAKELHTAMDVAAFDHRTASLVARLRHDPAAPAG
ncbi:MULTISPECIES: MarR family winged helix-turn-helix transcriptional regulator [unclassified Streptomyces]|uniref:MarR family winged helix-turn-helix transcriptional regulator n=1 Tax=unclassified Streptomyces TaxID=2593676 RepID=UPI002DD8AA06|nr:MarR family transcriptional regulator [Streptomyces sp. NBC_01294]WRZ56493.1 MarR family transcriptional regulator [Streptomyces sp. NBC_01294]